TFFSQMLRADMDNGGLTAAPGSTNYPGQYGNNALAAYFQSIITQFMQPTSPHNGLYGAKGQIAYEGGDNNSPQTSSYWAMFGNGAGSVSSVTFTGSISGATLTDAAGAATQVAIG